MHRGHIAELAPAFTHLARATKLHTFGLKQGLIEGSEVQALAAILLVRDIAASTDNLGLTHIAKLFDLGQQFRTCERHFED